MVLFQYAWQMIVKLCKNEKIYCHVYNHIEYINLESRARKSELHALVYCYRKSAECKSKISQPLP